MKTLNEALGDARRRRVAIGHFNVSDLVALKAVTGAARTLKVPVLIGTSEGERDFIGVREIVAVVASLREEFDHPIFLNADHTHSLEHAVEAANAGYDMIGFDVSTTSLEKNIELTTQAVEAVKSINPRIIVEGELGFIGSGSEIHEVVPESSRLLTKTDDAKRFVEATRIDVLAPAVGNMHGLLKSMISGSVRKRLDIGRIGELAAATGIPLTLHGGSGTDDGDFQRAISAGITIVHISTELRLAWRHGLEAALAENSDEVVPYKIYGKSLSAMAAVADERLRLFNAGEFATVSCRRCGPVLPPKVPLRFQESDEVSGRPGVVILFRLRQGASMGAHPDAIHGSDRSTSDLYPPGPDRPHQ